MVNQKSMHKSPQKYPNERPLPDPKALPPQSQKYKQGSQGIIKRKRSCPGVEGEGRNQHLRDGEKEDKLR